MSKEEHSKFELETLTKIDQIIERLDILIELMIPTPKIEDSEPGETGLEVLKLCDTKHTIEDMMKKLKKNHNTIKMALRRLREKGVIRSIKIRNKTYYIRIQ